MEYIKKQNKTKKGFPDSIIFIKFSVWSVSALVRSMKASN